MKGEIPGREPGIFPLVRHREDVVGVDMAPGRIASVLAHARRHGLQRIAVEPQAHVVAIELLRPDEACGRLTKHATTILVFDPLLQRVVEGVGFERTAAHDRVGRVDRLRLSPCGEAKPHDGRGARLEPEGVAQAELRAPGHAHRMRVAIDDEGVDPVLEEPGRIARATVPQHIRLVLAEQKIWHAVV